MNPLKHLNIQSKLILALLFVSLLSILTVTVIGYTKAREAFTRQVENQLVGQRIEKTNVLRGYLTSLKNQVVTLSNGRVTLEAMKEFRTAFAALKQTPPDPQTDARLVEFYEKTFLPTLAESGLGNPPLKMYLPTNPVARYLQYHYIAANPHPYDEDYKLEQAADGSAWSEAHAKYHEAFQKVATRFLFSDIMLIDAETLEVVYTYQKNTDLGTSLADGPYANANIGAMARILQKAADMDAYKMADFQLYAPDLGRPAAFIGSPIFDGFRMIGIVICRFPHDEVNRIMTGDFSWEKEGLGKTGEVYAVGRDFTLRSRSRFLHEHREDFVRELREGGVAESIIRQVEYHGLSLMALQARNPVVEAALLGKEGIATEGLDYRNKPVLTAYGPIDLDSVRWAIVADMDLDEAYAPLHDFARTILVAGTALSLLTSLLALWIGRVLTRPIAQLAEGARRVAGGETDVRVAVTGSDEFRELADAFNGMTRSLQEKNQLLEQKVQENENLLLNILPAPAAAQMREGYGDANQSFADVSVMFADVEGLDPNAEESLALLKELVVAFDEAAEQLGVEKVKTIGSSYFAVCGLSVQRPDHVSRIVEFARDLIAILRRFNAERDLNLSVDIGINAGPVVGGIVGRNKFIYDLWGDTVNIARGLPSGNSMEVIVTDEVFQRMEGVRNFVPAPSVEIKGKGTVKAWRLVG